MFIGWGHDVQCHVWLSMHKWKWVQNQELLKPLDMPFDLYLETQDVDDF